MADDVFSQFGQGMERGVKLAQHAEQLTQQREQLEESKKLNLIKVGDKILENYNSAILLNDKKARQIALEEARQTAAMLGKPVSDSVHAMMSSDINRTQVLQGLSGLLGETDDNKAKQLGPVLTILGGNGKDFADNLMRYNETRMKQAQIAAANKPDPYEPMKQLSAAQTSLKAQLGESITAVNALQSIHALSLDKSNNLVGHAATVIFNKLLDPPSVVREGEVATVSAATANGMIAKAAQLIRDKAGSGKLNAQEWQTILKAADVAAEVHKARINRVVASYEPLIKGTPLTMGQISAGLPQSEDLARTQQLSKQAIEGKAPMATTPMSEQERAASSAAFKRYGLTPPKAPSQMAGGKK